MKTKHAPKKPKPTFAYRLITAIRNRSEICPGKLLVIDFRTLELIDYFQCRNSARECAEEQPRNIHAVICDPIPPNTFRVC